MAKLNAVEKALMNNPVRAALQHQYEARLLRRMGGRTDGRAVLELGCGRGIGVEVAVRRFGVARVDAFDMDPDMISRARGRIGRYRNRVRLWIGDASAIAAHDNSYDVIFDFGIIHHVPPWRMAVKEVARVLRPGGRFFFEEVTRHALDRWLYRTFLDHPEDDRFTGAEFVAALESQGLIVGTNWVERIQGDFVLGVARKPARSAMEMSNTAIATSNRS